MDDTSRTPSPEPSSAGKWIGRVLIAVLLGEGIWGLIVSFTNNLILPLLARTMGGDAQSPLYLGKGDFNVPAVFTSVLELCFAGIAAVVLNSWVQRKPQVTRSQLLRLSPVQPVASSLARPAVVPAQAAASVTPISTPAPAPSTSPQPSSTPSPSPGQFWSPPEPVLPKAATAPTPAVKPQKPKPPKEVYYNIVGEPINPTEDE